jgi:hypothetical protein
MADTRTRTCTECGAAFESPRALGRPAEKCSDSCRAAAARKARRKYDRSLIEARDQLQALLATAA